jgi:hypothetical protein
MFYTPEIHFLNGAILAGGSMNKQQFEDDVVNTVCKACVTAGIDHRKAGDRA